MYAPVLKGTLMIHSVGKASQYLLMAVLCASAAAALDHPNQDNRNREGNSACKPEKSPCRKATVPEGGSAVPYLVLSGLACFTAITMRTRKQRA
jgi:hypothetical protein